jgi:hypothetical protein
MKAPSAMADAEDAVDDACWDLGRRDHAIFFSMGGGGEGEGWFEKKRQKMKKISRGISTHVSR